MRPVEGGYTQALRRIVTSEDGATAFLKCATDDRTRKWLLAEIAFYRQVTADFLPDVLGVDTGDPPLLLLEDLSRCERVPPWSAAQVDAVVGCVKEVRTCVADLPGYAEIYTHRGWHAVAEAPESFLSTGVVSEGWLKDCLPTLIEARDRVCVTGSDLLHLDLRSDNLCFRDGRAILFDWNNACIGNGQIDLGFWLPSLAHEGGPNPEDVLPGAEPIAAYVTGYFAEVAGRPGDARIRNLQRDLLVSGLKWTVRALHLPAPDGTGWK